MTAASTGGKIRNDSQSHHQPHLNRDSGFVDFFMQISNAPTKGRCGSITVSYFLVGHWNTFRQKRLRAGPMHVEAGDVVTAMDFLGPHPHVLFNSARFSTDNQRSEYHLTIASEDFVNDGVYCPQPVCILGTSPCTMRRIRHGLTECGSRKATTGWHGKPAGRSSEYAARWSQKS